MKSEKFNKRLALGLDLSTQGLSAVVLDIDTATRVYEHSLDYTRDQRLNIFGIRKADYLIPPRVAGEADQPPEMFFASLDAMFYDMQHDGLCMGDITVINSSGQQHGHVYLNEQASSLFARLREEPGPQTNLVGLLQGCLAYGVAPIWMTSNTRKEAEFIRDSIGGKERMIQLTGSNIPLRFTAPVIRRVAQQFAWPYNRTVTVQMLSSLVPAILTGNSRVPTDFGNACGTSLMHYRRKKWFNPLIQAASAGLPGGARAFRHKLPSIVAPDSAVGTIARYFSQKYGFSPSCQIIAGSGDNPQSKVLIGGDLLSLGSSIVNMISTDGRTVDQNGLANSMYDGVGRPFMFTCRTNGALVWDQVRDMHGLKKEEYGPAEQVLQHTPLAQNMVIWHPRAESFPPSGSFGPVRIGGGRAELASDYSGIIESTLAAVYYHSKHFSCSGKDPLFVTGGAARSQGILRRIASIWSRPVISINQMGPDTGAAVAGIKAFLNAKGLDFNPEQFSQVLRREGLEVQPSRDDISEFHRPGGFLDRFCQEESRLIDRFPIE